MSAAASGSTLLLALTLVMNLGAISEYHCKYHCVNKATENFLTPTFGVSGPLQWLERWSKNDILATAETDYRPERSCGKVIFSQACVTNSVHGGWGACMAGGAWEGGVCGRGVCVAGRMHGRGRCAWQEKRPLQWEVRNLLECILVLIIKWKKLFKKFCLTFRRQ